MSCYRSYAGVCRKEICSLVMDDNEVMDICCYIQMVQAAHEFRRARSNLSDSSGTTSPLSLDLYQ